MTTRQTDGLTTALLSAACWSCYIFADGRILVYVGGVIFGVLALLSLAIDGANRNNPDNTP